MKQTSETGASVASEQPNSAVLEDHEKRQSKTRRSQSQVPHKAHHSAYYRLVEACKQKDLDSIKVILAERPELANQRDKHNRTLFHYTAILVHNSHNRRQHGGVADLTESDRLCIDSFAYLTNQCDTKLWWQQDLDGLSVLHLAVISSNVALVRYLIYEHPYSIRYPLVCTLDNELHSPLHWAVITNNLSCVKLLIGYAGAKLAHEPDLNGATPLHYATQTRDYPKYRQQLRLMLESFNKLSSANSPPLGLMDSNSASELDAEEAASRESALSALPGDSSEQQQRGLEVLEYLATQAQINLECMDKDRRTPLLWAASSGNRDAIILLVSNGANALSADINKLGALHCAASHGFTDCLECLLNLAGSSSIDKQLATIVNQPDNLNCTPLFYSVLSGNIECVESLLERGAKHDWQDSKGRTAAHFAALKGQLNSLKLLHERGANLWLANKQGDLPLHYAIKSGRQQVARWLLEHSPYERAVNAINNFGRAPIHLAVMKDYAQMVDYLIGCGANLNQLVKVRDKSDKASGKRSLTNRRVGTGAGAGAGGGTESTAAASFHYETALDMARNLSHGDCFELLSAKNALPASQVIRNRFSGGGSVDGKAPGAGSSVFDLQTAEGASPIGFDTSTSSYSGSPSNTVAASSSGSKPLAKMDSDPTSTRRPIAGGQRNQGAPIKSTSLNRSQIPKLPRRPAPDSLPQTDSSESSALSQNSLTSVRGVPSAGATKRPSAGEAACGEECCAPAYQASSGAERLARKPYKGGISYNNEHINASIKCKLYKHEPRSLQAAGQNNSFPLDSNQMRRYQSGAQQSAYRQVPVNGKSQAQSRGYRSAGQEIITNVNVYTSPCPQCVHHQQQCEPCSSLAGSGAAGRQVRGVETAPIATGEPNALYSDETTDSEIASAAESEHSVNSDEHSLPRLASNDNEDATEMPPVSGGAGVGRIALARHLPPSQNHEQHLPVIMSDQERSVSGSSNEQAGATETNIADDSEQVDRSVEEQQQQQQASEATENNKTLEGTTRLVSPSSIEPCFDKSKRGSRSEQHRTGDRYRDLARSPVAEYIHSMAPHHDQDHNRRSISLSRTSERAPTRARQLKQPDFSKVKAKVDSHRIVTEAPEEALRSKSMSMIADGQSSGRASRQHQQHLGASSGGQDATVSRSSSRQTQVIRTRRLSAEDSVELATSVEKAIRKYRQEKTLFEELQNLKRSQIRSGRANEALLVKRLVEHFRKDTLDDLIGLEQYHGPYNYRSYERYLYDQLRKLSQSNCAKLESLNSQVDEHQFNQQDQRDFMAPLSPNGEERDFIEEDLRAELELRRVLGEAEFKEFEHGENKPSGVLNDNCLNCLNDDQDEVKEAESEQIQRGDYLKEGNEQLVRRASVSSSLGSSSRRSSVEVEREKLLNCRQLLSDNLPEPIEDQAASLTRSILSDALNNVSSRASLDRQTDEVEEEATPTPSSGRRRSVVNIGDKLEVIYHDVGIEINPASDPVDEQEVPANEMTPARVKTSCSSSSERLEDVQETEESDIDRAEHQIVDSALEDQADSANSQSNVDNELARDTRQTSGKETSSSETILIGSTSRRASSPSLLAFSSNRESHGELADIDSMGSGCKRRASLLETSLREGSVETMKKLVFNGHDLDEVRRKRALSREADSAQISSEQIRTASDRTSRHTILSPAIRRRKERSKYIRGIYKPKVPIEEVKRRWFEIKTEEMRKKRTLESGFKPRETFLKSPSNVEMSEITKSQPNLEEFSSTHLKGEKQEQLHRQDGENDKSSSRFNYVLLYEVNKGLANQILLETSGDRNNLTPTAQVQQAAKINWCHKKIVSIVDVRTLKRTLSLPESIIYSNNLLKRFNILKL